MRGIAAFECDWCHTALWPQQGIDLSGRRIAVIGTGASGVQIAQEAAKCAEKLTLFQRTPILGLPMRQERLTEDIQQRDKQGYPAIFRSEEHTSELQSLMRISYAVFCLKKKQL